MAKGIDPNTGEMAKIGKFNGRKMRQMDRKRDRQDKAADLPSARQEAAQAAMMPPASTPVPVDDDLGTRIGALQQKTADYKETLTPEQLEELYAKLDEFGMLLDTKMNETPIAE